MGAAGTGETRKQRGQQSVFHPSSIRGSLVLFIFGSPHFSVWERASNDTQRAVDCHYGSRRRLPREGHLPRCAGVAGQSAAWAASPAVPISHLYTTLYILREAADGPSEPGGWGASRCPAACQIRYVNISIQQTATIVPIAESVRIFPAAAKGAGFAASGRASERTAVMPRCPMNTSPSSGTRAFNLEDAIKKLAGLNSLRVCGRPNGFQPNFSKRRGRKNRRSKPARSSGRASARGPKRAASRPAGGGRLALPIA